VGDWRSWRLLRKRGDLTLLLGGGSHLETTERRLNENISSALLPAQETADKHRYTNLFLRFVQLFMWEYERGSHAMLARPLCL